MKNDAAAVFPAVLSVTDADFLAGPHTQDISDMIHVRPQYNDTSVIYINLTRLYKKLVHRLPSY